MTDRYSEALGFTDPLMAAPAPEADLDALWGYPPGFLNAAQWILLGQSTPQEMLEAMKALELQLVQGAGGPPPFPAGCASAMAVSPPDVVPACPIVRRSIRRGQSGRIRVVAGGRGHA